MPKFHLKGIVVNLLLATGLLVGTINAISVQRQVDEKRGALRHSGDFYRSFDRLHDDVKEMESGQRGYLLTGQLSYLQPYKSASDMLAQDLFVCRSLIQNDKEKIIYDEVEKLVNEKGSELAETIKLHDSGRHEDSLKLVKTNLGKEKMESISRIVKDIRSKYNEASASFRSISDKRNYYIIGVAVFCIYCVVTWISKYLVEKRIAAQNLQIAENIKRMRLDLESKMKESLDQMPIDLIRPMAKGK